MMNRQVKTSAEIAEWITEQVRQHDDGPDFKLTSVIPLKQPATDGCNWTIDSVLTLPHDCGLACDTAVAEARKRFNLPDRHT
jgi:hypothetical protein